MTRDERHRLIAEQVARELEGVPEHIRVQVFARHVVTAQRLDDWRHGEISRDEIR